MIYNKDKRALYTDYGEHIKCMFCPHHKKWSDLEVVPDSVIKRHCNKCGKSVLNTDHFTDEQVMAIVSYDHDVCLYVSEDSLKGSVRNVHNYRVIKTGKDKESINTAVKNGYWPVVKKVEITDKIKSKRWICQNEETGEIETISDYRMMGCPRGYKEVVPMHYDTSVPFPFSYAAYLVPNDLKVGERVFLEEVIEEFIGAEWNQGDTYRLISAEAIWNGEDFEIDYDENRDKMGFVG